MKVFKMNCNEYFAAETIEEALLEMMRLTGDSKDQCLDDTAHELTEEEMNSLTVVVDIDENTLRADKITFREYLDLLIQENTNFPCFFAGVDN